MDNLIEKLKKELKLQQEIEKDGGFGYISKGNHLVEVLSLNKQYRTENSDKYGYNADITDWIMKKYNIPPELKDILNTQVYFSQKDREKEKQNEYENKMLAEGFIKLTEEVVKKAIAEKKRLQVNATATNDWATIKIDKVYKPHIFNGNYGLMELKARSRGYVLYQFENAFCKLVN